MIEILKAGLLSSIQDLGRFGYRDQGVPLSGAMDQYSTVFANQLLGNREELAVIEFILQGARIHFQQSCRIAISGLEWNIELNGESISLNQAIDVPKDSVLHCKQAKAGMYAYLAIEGGFESEKVLGSHSYYPTFLNSAKLENGQTLDIKGSKRESKSLRSKINYQESVIASNKLEVFKGPEFELLDPAMQKLVKEGSFTLSKDSNRMAYILDHQLNLKTPEIITAPVEPGTVQLTPSGKMVILMRDAQTTGGYARILQLSPMAINQLAQKRPAEAVDFTLGS